MAVMSDGSVILEDNNLDDADEGVFEQGDSNSSGSADDETLSPLQRVQKYAQSDNVYDRSMVARLIPDLFETASSELLTEELPQIMQVFVQLGDDESLLRTDLLEQIPHIASQALQCSDKIPALKTITSEYLLPLVVRNLGNSEASVVKAAKNTLISLLEQELITKQQAEIQVCPTVLALASMKASEPYGFITVITLISKMAQLLGRDITERVFLDKFCQLCSSEIFFVRKMCASHIGNFCAVISKEMHEKTLLPCYAQLCKDEILGVRQSCAEVISAVSCSSNLEIRKTVLAPLFISLLDDECRFVKVSALQALGPFISTFANPSVTNIGYNNRGDLVLVDHQGSEYIINNSSLTDSAVSSQSNFQYPLHYNNMNKQSLDLYQNEGDGQMSGGEPQKNDDPSVLATNTLEEESEQYDEIIETTLEELINDLGSDPDVEDNFVKNDSESCETNDVISNAEIDLCDNVNNLAENVNNLSLKGAGDGLKCCKITDCNSNIDSMLDGGEVADNDLLNGNEDSQVNLPHTKRDDDNDNLHLFNSYNYWYVSPELPLDPSIVDEGRPFSQARIADICATILEYKHRKTGGLDDPNKKKAVCKPPKPSQDIVPQVLIDQFISMTYTSVQYLDNEIAYHCAYSLPAVALTLGGSNWDLLEDTVGKLAIHMQYKVRRTVASCLHQLALILGPDLATSRLTPIFDDFLRDLDEVKIGILKHLATFLSIIKPLKRSTYLSKLENFLVTDNQWNWRFRQELAHQLLQMLELFKPAETAKYISVIAQELLGDRVAAVRQDALVLICELVKYISSEPELTSRLLVKLAESFAHSKKWKRRQTFALLCSELLANNAISHETFAIEVMPHLLDLGWDPVANVRLVVARTISKYIVPNAYFRDPNNQHYDSLNGVLKRLQSDKDRDVRQSAEIGPELLKEF